MKEDGLGNDKGKRPHVWKGMVSLLLAAVMVFSAVFIVINADGTFASHNIDEHITDGNWSRDAHHVLYAQWAPNDDHIESGYVMEIAAACAMEALIIVCAVTVIMRRR